MKTTSSSKKVLIVVTSHSQMGSTGKATGYYLPEVSHPVAQLEKRGLIVDIVSPLGGKAPMDPSSRDLNDPINKAFLERSDLVEKIENTLRPQDVKPENYAAILYAGGHGTMWDFPANGELADLAAKIYENGGVVAAVCHGPAALLNIKLKDGRYLVDGKKLTGFSNAEEAAANLTDVMPFLLESELINRGGVYSKANLWQKYVVTDGRLVTGQNPASAEGVGEAVAKIISQG
ncbi:MAG: type 1 glutamine amidotransferase domain-containing protein [Pseudobdellovibrionaceae bacterium]